MASLRWQLVSLLLLLSLSFYLILTISTTPVQSSKSRKHLLNVHQFSHRKDHSQSSRLHQGQRYIKSYYISFTTKDQSPYNWTQVEHPTFLPKRDCDKYDLKCGPNSFCALTRDTNRPVCLCAPKKCHKDRDEYFCGTDEKTYRNLCQLYFRACMHGTNTRPRSSGRCAEIPSYYDDIKNLGCGLQSDFVSSPGSDVDYLKVGTCYQHPAIPVCGSDGQVYENLCALDQTNCDENVNTIAVDPVVCLKPNANPPLFSQGNRKIKDSYIDTLKYSGPMDAPMSACLKDDLECPPYASCELYEDNKSSAQNGPRIIHKCACNLDCQMTMKEPVCGTDGITYASLCDLKRTSCLEERYIDQDIELSNCLRPTVFFRLKNQVETTPYPLERHDIPTQGCIRMREANRAPGGICNRPPLEPVCGSDGRVYENLCALDQRNCLKNDHVIPVDLKLCLKANTSSELPPISYSAGKAVVKVSFGECQHDGIGCPHYHSCGLFRLPLTQSDYIYNGGTPSIDEMFGCKCKINCTSTMKEPVCATDGVAYASLCELRRISCFEKRSIEPEKDIAKCLKPTVYF